MVRIVSLGVLITAIAALGVMFFKVVAPFLLPLFLAAVAAVLCQPALQDALRRTKGREGLAAGIVTTAVMAGIMLPLTVAVIVAAAQAYSFSQQVTVDSLRQSRDEVLDYTAEKLVAWQDYLPTGVKPPDKSRAEAALLRFARETGVLEEDLPPDPEEELLDDVAEEPDENDGARDSVDASFDDSEPDIVADLAYVDRLPFGDGEAPMFPDDAAVVADLSDLDRDRFKILRDNYRLAVQTEEDPEQKLAFYRDVLTRFVATARENLDRTIVGVAGKTVGGTLGLVGQTLGVALGALVTLGIFLFALYYFLKDGPRLIEAAESLIPVHADYQRELLTQFATVVRAVVLATFLAALAQGVLATIALGILGFDHLLLLLVAVVVASLIPVAGTTLVWFPCAVILLVQERYLGAALLTAWGAGVVGTVDNVVRTYVLNNDTKLHPLLALISVLGGLQVMGFWGVFVGPIVASCLHALVKIFNQELTELSRETYGPDATAAIEKARLERRPDAPRTARQSTVSPDQHPTVSGDPAANSVASEGTAADGETSDTSTHQPKKPVPAEAATAPIDSDGSGQTAP